MIELFFFCWVKKWRSGKKSGKEKFPWKFRCPPVVLSIVEVSAKANNRPRLECDVSENRKETFTHHLCTFTNFHSLSLQVCEERKRKVFPVFFLSLFALYMFSQNLSFVALKWKIAKREILIAPVACWSDGFSLNLICPTISICHFLCRSRLPFHPATPADSDKR